MLRSWPGESQPDDKGGGKGALPPVQFFCPPEVKANICVLLILCFTAPSRASLQMPLMLMSAVLSLAGIIFIITTAASAVDSNSAQSSQPKLGIAAAASRRPTDPCAGRYATHTCKHSFAGAVAAATALKACKDDDDCLKAFKHARMHGHMCTHRHAHTCMDAHVHVHTRAHATGQVRAAGPARLGVVYMRRLEGLVQQTEVCQ